MRGLRLPEVDPATQPGVSDEPVGKSADGWWKIVSAMAPEGVTGMILRGSNLTDRKRGTLAGATRPIQRVLAQRQASVGRSSAWRRTMRDARLRVDFEIGDLEEETPMARESRVAKEKRQKAESDADAGSKRAGDARRVRRHSRCRPVVGCRRRRGRNNGDEYRRPCSKHAREMQSRLNDVQESLKNASVTGESGAGLVKVTLNGRFEALRVEIDPVAASEDRAVQEDLIAGGLQRCRAARRTHAQGKDGRSRAGHGSAAGIGSPGGAIAVISSHIACC